jgi:hypothetical protein
LNMDRVGRWALNTLVIASFLLFVATIALWCRSSSYFFGWDDVIQYDTHHLSITAASSRGELALIVGDVSKFGSWYSPDRFRYNAIFQVNNVQYRAPNHQEEFHIGPFYLARYAHIFQTANGHQAPMTQWDMGIPYWAVAIVAGVMPAFWFASSRQRRRQSGQCRVGGFDVGPTKL